MRSGAVLPYTVMPGKSVEDEIAVGVLRGLKTGTRRRSRSAWSTPTTWSRANDVASAEPVVVRPGDTNARHAAARASPSRGRASQGVGARCLRADIAGARACRSSVRRLGGECRWLSSADGDLRTVDESAAGKCDEPVWVTVKGTERWSLRLAKRLPNGRYELRTRAVLRQRPGRGSLHASGQEPDPVPRAARRMSGAAFGRPDTRFALLCGGRSILAALLGAARSGVPRRALGGSAGRPGRAVAAAHGRRDLDVRVVEHDLPADAARREVHDGGARGHVLPAASWDEVNPPPTDTASAGTIDFQHTDTGLVNTNYQSSQPPPRFPILCASRHRLRQRR